jgi:glycosyltransferase involved in cell wall biosynthesis
MTWIVEPTLSTADWLTVFETVRSALRTGDGPAANGQREEAADFYATSYLLTPAHAGYVPSGASLTDLRRTGRVTVVVVPERLGIGLLSPCAYIRLLQPLDHPAIGGDMDIIIADADTALDYRADIIVTQRYAIGSEQQAERLTRHARATGATLVYDLDDDLLNIPVSHPDAGELRPKAGVVRQLVRHADQVWVSTDCLKRRLAALRTDVIVVPNGLDDRLWCSGPPPARQDRFGPVRILYMGTATHDSDFAIVAPALERLKRDFAWQVEITIVGVTAAPSLPDWVQRMGVSANGAQSYPGFVNWITGMPPWDIGLVPLAETPFNLSKSTIKTLDYAALGLAVVASDMPVYRGSLADGAGGRLVANHPDAWYRALSELVRDPKLRERLRQGAARCFLEFGTLAAQAAARRGMWQQAAVQRSKAKQGAARKTATEPAPPAGVRIAKAPAAAQGRQAARVR